MRSSILIWPPLIAPRCSFFFFLLFSALSGAAPATRCRLPFPGNERQKYKKTRKKNSPRQNAGAEANNHGPWLRQLLEFHARITPNSIAPCREISPAFCVLGGVRRAADTSATRACNVARGRSCFCTPDSLSPLNRCMLQRAEQAASRNCIRVYTAKPNSRTNSTAVNAANSTAAAGQQRGGGGAARPRRRATGISIGVVGHYTTHCVVAHATPTEKCDEK